jgi:hypothetical protein
MTTESCWLDNLPVVEYEGIETTYTQKGEITMSTPNENPNVPEAPIFDPFPETNTMPSGWDLSGLASDPAPAPTAQVEESSEA